MYEFWERNKKKQQEKAISQKKKLNSYRELLRVSNENSSEKVRNIGKSKEIKEFEQQFSEFFNPKVDIERSLKNKQIIFEKPKRPIENPDGTLVPRSIIGTQQMMDEALF